MSNSNGAGVRRSAASLALVIIALLVMPWGSALAQTRKVVGVAFDNSGSMGENGGRTNLPVFGIQVLAASLDQKDRLYALNFRDFLARVRSNGNRVNFSDASTYLTNFSLDSPPSQRASIAQLKTWADNPRDGTPFEAVQVMLEHLANVAEKDDDVHAFIFTDGDFNKPPTPDQMQQIFQDIRSRSKAERFSVYFMAFSDAATLSAIKQQQVAATLDRIFNGGTGNDVGCDRGHVFYLNNFATLRKCLVDVVKKIADTPGDPDPTVVTRRGNVFVVKPPFTISKVIAMSTAQSNAALPQTSKWPSEIGRPEVFDAAMARADSERALPGSGGQVWYGRLTHMRPFPALPAERPFEIQFNQPIDLQTDLLFRTNITIEWVVIDPQTGQTVVPDNGVITLSADKDYQIRAHVNDVEAGRNPQVLPVGSAAPAFTLLHRDDQNREVRLPMKVDNANNWATAALRYGQERDDDVSVALRMNGFATAQGRKLKIKVVKTNLKIDFSRKALCPGCTDDKLEPVISKSGDQEIMQITASARRDGNSGSEQAKGLFTLKLDQPLPPGLKLAVPGTGITLEGSQVDAEVELELGKPLALSLLANDALVSTMGSGVRPTISLVPKDPRMLGSGSTSFLVQPKLGPVQIIYKGTTDVTGVGQQFRARPDGLRDNNGVFVEIAGAFRADPAHLKLSLPGLALEPAQAEAPGVFRVIVRPGTWCDCFVRSGTYPLTATFDNGLNPVATTRLPDVIITDLTWFERVMICLLQIIALLAAIYLAAGILRFLQSYRLPRSSRLLIYPANKRNDFTPRVIAKQNRAMYLMLPFLLPFRRWHQRLTVEGLNLEARPGGVVIRPPAQRYGHLRKTGDRKPLSEQFNGADPDGVLMMWGQRIEELGGQRMVYEFAEKL